MRKRHAILLNALLLFAVTLFTAPQASLACNNGSHGKNGVEVSPMLGIKGGGGADANCLGGTINGDYTNPIYALVIFIIQFASAALALVMVLMIVIAGLQYVLSGTSPDAAKDAKDRIKNTFTGFILFILMWGILTMLFPTNAGTSHIDINPFN